ncbi:nuclear transport factor 2 family protein [Mucilaginibacter jinjuensis]|uniref:Nuclear transport factor 2 family protein n=1 Tax=Mucilaginibacter jinjuensis TaxID=1176721 RepID=A0ABY7T9V4_9SPHI|nr:nuclear transport factor 2 family protein [Mucilaginibacter jinjuensis]WCT13274.1 nuclear transport factor 2 family protein [Mucilaginibacter jinjuensis]
MKREIFLKLLSTGAVMLSPVVKASSVFAHSNINQMKSNITAKQLLFGYLENINDADKVIELFADDAVIELPYLKSLGMPWQWRGKDVLHEFLKEIPEMFPGFAFKDIQIHIDTPDQVFAEYSVDCKAASTGRPYQQTYMGRLVAKDGKIQLLREALDMAQVAKSMAPFDLSDHHEGAVAGIDHIGINVPDIDAATVFLQKAFGAEVVYESYSKKQSPLEFEGVEATLNVALHTKLYACRMIKIGHGPNIELFEVHVDGQKQAILSSDLGLQHFAVYTDNIKSALEKFAAAGGKVLSEPARLLFPLETGAQNYFCYARTPWGTSVEFITYPEGMPYENGTHLRRWKAGLPNAN